MPQAMRVSSFCLTTATANISEPMMNSTESVIRLFATVVDSMPSSTTSATMIINATVGSGTGSVMNRMVATSEITSTMCPAPLRPAGVGRLNNAAPRAKAMTSQRFSMK